MSSIDTQTLRRMSHLHCFGKLTRPVGRVTYLPYNNIDREYFVEQEAERSIEIIQDNLLKGMVVNPQGQIIF